MSTADMDRHVTIRTGLPTNASGRNSPSPVSPTTIVGLSATAQATTARRRPRPSPTPIQTAHELPAASRCPPILSPSYSMISPFPSHSCAPSRAQVGQPFRLLSPPQQPPQAPLSPYVNELQALHSERAYLLSALERQDDRVKRLLASLAEVEASRIAATTNGNEADERGTGGAADRGSPKLRKKARLIKSKIAEAEQQERRILLRLSDLYAEILKRERRATHTPTQTQAQAQAQQLQPLFSPPLTGVLSPWPLPSPNPGSDSPSPGGAGFPSTQRYFHSCIGRQRPGPHSSAPPSPLRPSAKPFYFPADTRLRSPTSPSCLSPLSPTFVPGGVMFSDPFSSDRRAVTSSSSHRDASASPHDEDSRRRSSSPADKLGPSDATSAKFRYEYTTAAGSEDEGQAGEDDEDEAAGRWDSLGGGGGGALPMERPAAAARKHRRSVSLNGLSSRYALTTRDSRMSLPSLRSIWPEAC